MESWIPVRRQFSNSGNVRSERSPSRGPHHMGIITRATELLWTCTPPPPPQLYLCHCPLVCLVSSLHYQVCCSWDRTRREQRRFFSWVVPRSLDMTCCAVSSNLLLHKIQSLGNGIWRARTLLIRAVHAVNCAILQTDPVNFPACWYSFINRQWMSLPPFVFQQIWWLSSGCLHTTAKAFVLHP